MSKIISPWRVLAKGLCLFLVFEFSAYALNPNLQWLSSYDLSGLKRQRFPISTNAPEDAALDMDNLNAMLASHIVSEPKAPDEYRVFVLGDSAVWGIGLTPKETLPGQMDALGLKCGNKIVHVYNLSFPYSSSTKDLMILDKAMSYQPDEIVWLITWETLTPKSRTNHPLIDYNIAEYSKLAHRFNFLPKNYQSPNLVTLITDQNITWFRILRYQLYSLITFTTGLDQIQIPLPYDKLQNQLSKNPAFDGMKPPTLHITDVSLDQVKDFYQIAGNVPVILVNEPMEVLTNVPNSDVFYNRYYPRWVYDQYRQYVSEASMQSHWNYLDLWDIFPPSYYIETPLHVNSQGETELAKIISSRIVKGCQ